MSQPSAEVRARYRDSEKWRQWWDERLTLVKMRRAVVNAWKADQGCIDCGYDDPRALDFDHRVGEVKLFSPALGIQGSVERWAVEVAKCDVRCANCHRIITDERRRLDSGE